MTIRVNAMSFGNLVALMLEGGHTLEELAELTGLHYGTVRVYVRGMHKAGAAFVDHWEKDSRGRYAIKSYRVGTGKDAKPPKAMTPAQRQRRYYAKKKAVELLHTMAGATSERPAEFFHSELSV